jgi:gamma-glutamyltranspeptidase/glutathione hydrolase
MHLLRSALLSVVLISSACARATPPAPSGPDLGKRAVAEHGMVASGNPYASQAGVDMLMRGGNAVDAAVATAFALGVTEPMMSGLGAGGGAVVWNQKARHADYVDFYSAAGAVVDTGVRGIRGSATTRGVAVPGAVAGLLAMQAKYGKLTRAEVMAPAIRLAAEGHTANSLLAREVAVDTAKIGRYEGARRIFIPQGRPVRIGDHVVQPELAATMRAIAEQGPAAFYAGPFAQAVVATLRAGGSTLAESDFAAYQPRWERPLCGTYRGRVVLTAGAPLSGMQVLEALNLLEPMNLPSVGLPSRDPAAFDMLVGALRVAVADRDAYIGDPKFVAVPQAGVSSKRFAESRRGSLNEAGRTRLAAGNPWAADAEAPSAECVPYAPAGPATGTRTAVQGLPGDGQLGETTHLSVVDAEGNAVSLTNTLGLNFGTGTWVNGVFFNSAMFNFARNDSGPNRAGPMHIPATTIAPSILLRDGAVEMVVGSPGSAAIPPAIVSTILYTLDYGMDPLAALRMPRVIPNASGRLQVEDGFAFEVLAAARKRFDDVVTSPPTDMGFGGVTVLLRTRGHWVGAADPRRDGEVRGY